MSDPLRPLTGLVESIAQLRRVSQSVATSNSTTSSAKKEARTVAPSQDQALPFAERLQALLAVIPEEDLQKRRRVFVELVLSQELGTATSIDPQFGFLVDEVCIFLDTDAATTRSLDIVLANLVQATLRP